MRALQLPCTRGAGWAASAALITGTQRQTPVIDGGVPSPRSRHVAVPAVACLLRTAGVVGMVLARAVWTWIVATWRQSMERNLGTGPGRSSSTPSGSYGRPGGPIDQVRASESYGSKRLQDRRLQASARSNLRVAGQPVSRGHPGLARHPPALCGNAFCLAFRPGPIRDSEIRRAHGRAAQPLHRAPESHFRIAVGNGLATEIIGAAQAPIVTAGTGWCKHGDPGPVTGCLNSASMSHNPIQCECHTVQHGPRG
jgi:hypothetical protein